MCHRSWLDTANLFESSTNVWDGLSDPGTDSNARQASDPSQSRGDGFDVARRSGRRRVAAGTDPPTDPPLSGRDQRPADRHVAGQPSAQPVPRYGRVFRLHRTSRGRTSAACR